MYLNRKAILEIPWQNTEWQSRLKLRSQKPVDQKAYQKVPLELEISIARSAQPHRKTSEEEIDEVERFSHKLFLGFIWNWFSTCVGKHSIHIVQIYTHSLHNKGSINFQILTLYFVTISSSRAIFNVIILISNWFNRTYL